MNNHSLTIINIFQIKIIYINIINNKKLNNSIIILYYLH